MSSKLLILLVLAPLVSGQCVGLWSSMFDDWCDLNCNHAATPFCPPAFCSCSGNDGDDPVGANLAEHNAGCCDLNVHMYYIDRSAVYYVELDKDTHEPVADPVQCAQFLGPSDIEIDVDQNVIVADPVAGAVYRIQPNCGDVDTITSWSFDQIIDQPTALSLSNGGLYVSGSRRVYFLTLSDEYELVDHEETDISIHHVDAMDSHDGWLYFIERAGQISKYEYASGDIMSFLSVHQHGIPDMKGIKVTDCGMYISVTDSNQVWYCSDPMDVDTCGQYCPQDGADADSDNDIDASSCLEYNNPFGLTLDCNCKLYTANRGNGQIVCDENGDNPVVILDNLYHPIDVEVYVPHDCSPPSESNTPTATRTPSTTPTATRTPSTTPSATRSPSPSRSPTPSPSSSPSPTSSPSPSPSTTPEFILALKINDFNEECAVGECVFPYNETIAAEAGQATRLWSVRAEITYDIFDLDDSLDCDLDTQIYSIVPSFHATCTRSVDADLYFDFSAGSIKFYYEQAGGGVGGNNVIPANIFPPAVYPANLFPNPYPNPTISGLIDCTNFNNGLTLLVWDPVSCWNDPYFNAAICAPARSTPGLEDDDVTETYTLYVDNAGNNPPPLAPFKKLLCIDDEQ